MWLLPLTRILVLAAAADAPAADLAPLMPQPIATRQTVFSIPFRVERGDPAATEPVGVQLQMSTDRGATWRVYSRVAPHLGQFPFRAASDGEYWFVVQTIDGQGHFRPPQPTTPGLSVVVDTTPPRIDLEAIRGEGGEITARWRITELNPKPDSLRILYRVDPSQPWQSLAIDRGRISTSGPVQSGEATWWPEGNGRRIEIRAESSDLAGNANVSHAHVNVPEIPAQNQNLTAMAPRTQWRSSTEPPAAPRGLPATSAPALASNAAARDASFAPPSGNPFRSESNPNPPPSAGSIADSQGPAYRSASLPPQQPSVAIQIHPLVGSQFVPPGGSVPATPGPVLGGTQPRMVNTTMFELEYAFDSVGPSGVARVELWGTRDGGKTWSSFGTDDDTQSPMIVNAPGEGPYGFRVAVESGVGLGGDPPVAGTVPDLWIGVDLTKPDVRLLASRQSTGIEAGKLMISWEARDSLLASQPISLFYSQAPGGPWTPIAANLENTGNYGWDVPATVPDEFFLRVEVRDAAGNLGICESPQSIHLDRQRPNVRIRGVRPLQR